MHSPYHVFAGENLGTMSGFGRPGAHTSCGALAGGVGEGGKGAAVVAVQPVDDQSHEAVAADQTDQADNDPVEESDGLGIVAATWKAGARRRDHVGVVMIEIIPAATWIGRPYASLSAGNV